MRPVRGWPTILNLGGTITERYDETRLTGRLSAADLVMLAGQDIGAVDIALKDSSDLSFDEILAAREAIRRDQDSRGFVLCCGTDALEEAAYAAALLLPRERPWVVTAASHPSTSPRADGARHLRQALAVLASLGRDGTPVLVFGGLLFDIARVSKLDPGVDQPFGPISAQVGAIAPEGVRFFRPPMPIPIYRDAGPDVSRARVAVVSHTFGALAHLPAPADVDGLVVAGCGPGGMSAALRDVLRTRWIGRVPVVVSSRCAAGFVRDGFDPKYAMLDLIQEGFIVDGYEGLNASKARLKLILDLSAGAGKRM